MVALTEGTDYEVVGLNRGDCTNEIIIKVINTSDTADTLTVDLGSYGIADDGFVGALGFTHTTDNSVSVQEQPSTAVSTGTLTLTIGGSTASNQPRFYKVIGLRDTAAVSSL